MITSFGACCVGKSCTSVWLFFLFVESFEKWLKMLKIQQNTEFCKLRYTRLRCMNDDKCWFINKYKRLMGFFLRIFVSVRWFWKRGQNERWDTPYYQISSFKLGRCFEFLNEYYGFTHGGDRKSNENNFHLKSDSEKFTQKDLAESYDITQQTMNNYMRLANMIPVLIVLVNLVSSQFLVSFYLL